MSEPERPRGSISFSIPMLLAIRAGVKTQTRRAMNPQPQIHWSIPPARIYGDFFNRFGCFRGPESIRCPYGGPGTRLLIKEPLIKSIGRCVLYASDREPVFIGGTLAELQARKETPVQMQWKWKPSKLGAMYMPHVLSRTTIEIVERRAERLHALTTDGAVAEGALTLGQYAGDPIERFAQLWNQINGRGSYEANPWAWVLKFKVLK